MPAAHPNVPSAPRPLDATSWAPPNPDGYLYDRIAAIPRPQGSVGVAVQHLTSGQGASVDADKIVPPASLFKLGIMVAVMRAIDAGTLSAETLLEIHEEDWAPGAGLLQDRIGEVISVDDALRLMIGISDNVAAFVLLRVLGVRRLNEVTASLGMTRTTFYVDDRPDETSAGDVATVLARIATGEAAGVASTRSMLALMSQRQPAAWIRHALRDVVPVAHKSGQLPGVRNDAGIITAPGGPYVLAVLTQDLVDDASGERYIAEVARAIDQYFAGER